LRRKVSLASLLRIVELRSLFRPRFA